MKLKAVKRLGCTHTYGMKTNRLPKQALECKPLGRRDSCTPEKETEEYRVLRNTCMLHGYGDDEV
jgi:hypothetical protein